MLSLSKGRTVPYRLEVRFGFRPVFARVRSGEKTHGRRDGGGRAPHEHRSKCAHTCFACRRRERTKVEVDTSRRGAGKATFTCRPRRIARRKERGQDENGDVTARDQVDREHEAGIRRKIDREAKTKGKVPRKMCCSREPPERDVFVSHMKGLMPLESAGGVSHNVPVRIQLRHQRETSFDSESSTTDDSPRKKAKLDESGKDPARTTATGYTGTSKRMSAEEASIVESFWSSTVSNKWWPFDQVVENARTYCAASFAPGIGPGDVQVDVDGTTLHIEVQDNWDVELPGGDLCSMTKVENTKLHLYRTFELPSDVDSNAMYGNLIDGIFTLVMPKKAREASH